MNTIIVQQPKAAPSSYDSSFKTAEGIIVKTTFLTSNKYLADQYEANLSQQMGWEIVSAPEWEPKSRAEAALMGLCYGLGMAAIAWIVGIIVIVVGHMASFYNYNESLETMSTWTRCVVYGWGISVILLPIVCAVRWKPTGYE